MALTAQDISELYERNAARLLAYFARKTLQADAAFDMVGECFAVAFEQRDRFRGDNDQQAQAWLWAIARAQLHEYFRRGRVERAALERLAVEVPQLWPEEYERIEAVACLPVARSSLVHATGQLNDAHYEVLRMRVIEELPYDEIAARIGTTPQTARARVSRALRELRDLIGVEDPEELMQHG